MRNYIYRSKTTDRRKTALKKKYQVHTYDTLEETESFSTLNYTSESPANETAEISEQDRLSRYPGHDRVSTKECYRCGDDKYGKREWIDILDKVEENTIMSHL